MAHILVAEDSPDIRELIRMLLESAGHRVDTVADGRAAVAAARESAPELILMDLSLPILSGWEAARQIHADARTSSIPILAVTAHAMQGDRERALAAGCDGFIAKPIDEEAFAGQVASFIGARPMMLNDRSRPRALRDEPGRVLLVDDQPDIAVLVRADLEADGHTVVVATRSEEAIAAFEKDSGFDLAIVDVILAGDSGYELTEALTTRSPSYLPVLLVTAGTIDREKAYAAGADDFIGKPIESLELRLRAASLIRIGRLVRERHRNGHERSDAYRKLQELDRMRSDFLSTVSHELRTPLNTIILLAHQLEKNDVSTQGDDPRRSRNVRLLRDAAEALRRMIDNILDLAKLEAGQRDVHAQPVIVPDLLRETAELLEPQAREKGLEIRVESTPGLPEPAWLDREKLSRVLVNLVSNAVKFTPKGRVLLRAQPWQGSITFEVDDTGIGIPPELVAAAFEPFRQIRPRNGETRGTGLGLSISKQLVEAMGGDLFLDSREGRGTRVTFTVPELPAEAVIEADDRAAAASPRPEPSRRARVLIVEDDHASRYGLRALLESEGYDVNEASTLQEAELELRRTPPEVVILDITLPDGDGAVWLQRRTEKESFAPAVIALTGVTADADTRRIDAAGVRTVLTKPVNVTQLLLTLRDLAQPQPLSPPAGRRTTHEAIAISRASRDGIPRADASGREPIQRGEPGQKKYDE
ncbi:MAG TPA: response regulator [Thermoanaerobaculia bacterium]|jgi:CheY-like chemotaxis protein/anti-sigma regulatory factor (Ser/Thr protein kinase)|nr:response regulator [Thermoanaerobaculia bacterium]